MAEDRRLRRDAAMDASRPGIGETIGGSQREERLDMLDTGMAERGIDKELYAWHRDLRRYGTVPLAGSGLGLERTIAYVTRDVLRVSSSGQTKSRPAARNPDGGECFNNRPVIGSGN